MKETLPSIAADISEFIKQRLEKTHLDIAYSAVIVDNEAQKMAVIGNACDGCAADMLTAAAENLSNGSPTAHLPAQVLQ